MADERIDMADFRREMESYWRDVAEQADSLKDPSFREGRLLTLYKRFDADERLTADQVLGEWALSEDEALRFDALLLIDKLKIATAASALNRLLDRLASSGKPGAPYEAKRVNRIIGNLM
jgi:hypothetical protein